jgi:hypothetical protein
MTPTAEEKIDDPAHEIHEAISLILNMAALKVGPDCVENASQSPYPIADPNYVS